MNRIYIDKYTGKIERTDIYLVKVTLKDGTVLEDLEPRRLFPMTMPEMYITLVDDHDHEIAFVRGLDELDPTSAQAISDCFKDYYRIPYVTRILSGKQKFGCLMWEVETDCGNVRFQIRNIRYDLKRIGNRVLIRDSNDNRYEIADCTALDKKSRSILFAYL